MKAISLWQPWASAMAIGVKRVETRSWKTYYRGPIAIHAAARKKKIELIHWHAYWHWKAAMAPLLGDDKSFLDLPFGAIVGVGYLAQIEPTDQFTQVMLDTRRHHVGQKITWCERDFGDYTLGRFGWIFSKLVPLAEPIPCKGHQGIWNFHQDLSHLLDT